MTTCSCNQSWTEPHSLGCPMYAGSRHYCGPMCRANAVRLRRSYVRPMDAPLTAWEWVRAFAGGVAILAVAFGIAILGGALAVGR